MDLDTPDASTGIGTTCGIAVPLVLALAATVVILLGWSRQPAPRRSFGELVVLLAAHVLGSAIWLVLVPLLVIGALGSEIASTGTRMIDPQSGFGAWMSGAVEWCLALALSGIVTGPAMTMAAIAFALQRRYAWWVGAAAAALCVLHHLLAAIAIGAIAFSAYDAPSDGVLRALLLLFASGVLFVGVLQAAGLAWVARRARRDRALLASV